MRKIIWKIDQKDKEASLEKGKKYVEKIREKMKVKSVVESQTEIEITVE